MEHNSQRSIQKPSRHADLPGPSPVQPVRQQQMKYPDIKFGNQLRIKSPLNADNSRIDEELGRSFQNVALKSVTQSKQLYNQSIVYSKTVPVYLTQFGSRTMDHHPEFLRFEMELISKQSQSRDYLNVVLSSDNDPTFLYFCQIDQAFFLDLKKEQNLLIDFAMLPEKISCILDLCISEYDEQDSKYVAIGEQQNPGQSISLTIFEHTEFRHLLHLQLPLTCMTDADSKEYLGKKLMIQKKVSSDLQQERDRLLEKQDEDQQVMNEINENLAQLKEDNEIYTEKLREEKIMSEQSIQDDFQTQLKEQENHYEATIDQIKEQYEQKIKVLSEQVEDKVERLKLIEKERDVLEERVQGLDQEKRAIAEDAQLQNQISKENVQEIEDLKTKYNKLDKECLAERMRKEQESQMNQNLQEKMERMQGEKKEYEQDKQKLKEEILELQKSINALEEENKIHIKENEKLEKKLNKQKDKMEKEKEKKKKIKKELKEAEKKTEFVEGHKQEAEDKVVQLEGQLEKLRKEIVIKEELLQKNQELLKETQQALQSNKQVIDYLNKNLNEAQKFSFRTLLMSKQPEPGYDLQEPKDQLYRKSSPLRARAWENKSPGYSASQSNWNNPISGGAQSRAFDTFNQNKMAQFYHKEQSPNRGSNAYTFRSTYGQQLERDKIVSEDRFRQRFEEEQRKDHSKATIDSIPSKLSHRAIPLDRTDEFKHLEDEDIKPVAYKKAEY